MPELSYSIRNRSTVLKYIYLSVRQKWLYMHTALWCTRHCWWGQPTVWCIQARTDRETSGSLLSRLFHSLIAQPQKHAGLWVTALQSCEQTTLVVFLWSTAFVDIPSLYVSSTDTQWLLPIEHVTQLPVAGACWMPCPISHWQPFSLQVRTV